MTDARHREVLRLSDCDGQLSQAYDVVMFDLDGVIYVGDEPVPGVASHVSRLREAEVAVAFVTNNASRTPDAVAERLRGMGVQASTEDVVTSAQAVARLIAERLPAGARVLTVGGAGLVAALAEHGLIAVRSMEESPEAVVQGFAQTIDWPALAEAAHAINSGLPWFVSNTDRTIPTARGVAPGNGTLVAAVGAAVNVEPVVAGKPQAALFDETVERVGGARPLVVGDRLDTDILGANRVGADSLLVLTGVSRLGDVAAAQPHERPSFIAQDLAALFEPHGQLQRDGAGLRCAGWCAWVEEDAVHVRRVEPGSGATALLRAAVGVAWQHVDTTGSPADMQRVDDQLRSGLHAPSDGRHTGE